MTSVRGIFRILCLLFVQSVIWSMCVCKPINKAELSPWDDDDWFRRWTMPTFDWTVAPSDTSPRGDFIYGGTNLMLLAIFFPIIFICFLCIFCRCGLWKNDCLYKDDASDSESIMHTPPVNPLPARIYTTSEVRNVQQFQTPTRYFDFETSNSINNLDKPPGYSDIVLSDLVGENTKFPRVHVQESPPPNYEGFEIRVEDYYIED